MMHTRGNCPQREIQLLGHLGACSAYVNRAPPSSVHGDSSHPRHQRPEASSLDEPGPNGLRLTMSARGSTQHQSSSPILPRTFQTSPAATLRASR